MKDLLERYDQDLLLDSVESEKIDLEEDIEETEQIADSTKRKLYVDKMDKSTSDLFRMIVEGELNLQPEYQRKFVWNDKTMSKFIESLLLSIPIPTIFLAENYDDTFEVIDGQQRLSTIFAFMRSKLVENDTKLSENLKKLTELELKGLDTLRQYNGKKYTELDDAVQRKFNNVSLPIVIIKKDSTEDIKYDIFSRINSGSIKLNNQELLNVMYRGLLISTLNKNAITEKVDEAFGNRPVLKKRFGYHEILLRAKVIDCFISSNTWKLQEVKVQDSVALGIKKEYKKYNGRLNTAVMEYLKEYRNNEEEAKSLEKYINESIDKVVIVFGENAFKRINSAKSTSINKTIAELQLVVLSRFSLEEVNKYKCEILESFNKFLKDTNSDIFTRGTNNTSNIEKRYEWGIIVSEIMKGE